MSTSAASTGVSASRTHRRASIDLTQLDEHYRVAAFPADYAMTDDVILCDQFGRSYLLSQDVEQPLPLDDDIADSLGMFFEPSQDSSWHTAPELRRMIYGITEESIPVL